MTTESVLKPSHPLTVGILLFDGVEVLDFCGPFEVFASASQPGDAPGGEHKLFDVITIAEAHRLIRCRGGLLVMPHHDFTDHPPLDIVVIPGGPGTRRERENPVSLEWIARQHERTAITASVCTGAFLLAAGGLLDGRRATTHWASLDWLRQHYPRIDVRAEERVVDEGRLVTSAGVSAGIDMALHIVSRLFGNDVAAATARDMEYVWSPATHREQGER
jgi:transcriptional regulator GlxA family with amidase domain